MFLRVLSACFNFSSRVQIREGELRTKITKHLKNLKVDKGFVGDVPDKMAKLLGKRSEKLICSEAAQPGKRIKDDPHTDGLLRFVQGNREGI